jgi:beta-lactamase class C
MGIGNTAYGLGWRMFDYGRYKNFSHHGGWVKGFRSEVVFNRELGIGMVLLTNSETRLARNVIFKFMDLHEIAQQAAKDTAKVKAKETANTGGFRLSPIANDY